MLQLSTEVPPVTKSRTRNELLGVLYELFRCSGFDGVSIHDISDKSGLGKSSLYHYFPGGKEEMARAVIELARSQVTQHVFTPLTAALKLSERIAGMMAGIDRLYGDGRRACIMASLLLGHESDGLGALVAPIFREWEQHLSRALIEAGCDMRSASHRAERALVTLQGALLLQRVLTDRDVFERAKQDLPHILLDGWSPGDIAP